MRSLGLIAMLLFGACAAPAPLAAPCVGDQNCNLAVGGRCLPSPLGTDQCAYPSAACGGGLAWGELSSELGQACVAPDGDASVDAPSVCESLIAFTRSDGLYVVRPDGTGLTSISSGAQEARPVWSPDGSRLLVERVANGAIDIFAINADGTGLANLTNSPKNDTSAVWSPDGARIAFTTERNYSGSGSDVYVMDADGRSPTMIDERADQASWAPDGARIAYASYKSGRFQVYTANPDGSNSTNLTGSSFSDSSPR